MHRYGDAERRKHVLQDVKKRSVNNMIAEPAPGHVYLGGTLADPDKTTIGDEEDRVLITVSNTGCTLPPDEAVHIFDSFYRGSNAENRSGSGLGLYICKKLMTLMNGEIFAEVGDDLMKVTVVCPQSR